VASSVRSRSRRVSHPSPRRQRPSGSGHRRHEGGLRSIDRIDRIDRDDALRCSCAVNRGEGRDEDGGCSDQPDRAPGARRPGQHT